MKYPFQQFPKLSQRLAGALLLTFFLCCPHAPAKAQEGSSPVKALAVGEQVPDVPLANLLHYPADTARLSDFRGKLVIVEFWASWCGTCLLTLPKMEALQQTFGDSIRVLTVTSQPQEEVEAFLSRNPVGKRMTLPIVLGNERLQELFPYKAVPHLVWIAPDGTLLSQTGPYDATPETVRRLLRGQAGNFKDHKQDVMDYDFAKPLFVDGNGGSPIPLYRSILTPYIPGLSGGSGNTKTDSTMRFHIVNASVPQLFRASFGLPSFFPEKQILLASEKARAFQVHNWVEERRHKNYTYEMLLPVEQADNLHPYMRQDLERLFGLKAGVRQKRIDCWELTLLNRQAVPLSKGGEPLHNFVDITDPDKFMRNESISKLVVFLNKHLPDLPVRDKTGITRPLDLQLSGEDLQDPDRLNAALAAYGLQLKKKKRPLPVLTIQ